MKIGIFGGSFNPPHKMHENIASYFIEKHILDRVIFVPTGSKYKYKNNLALDSDRLNMLKIIASKHDGFYVSDNELKDEVVYTYETLDYFKKKYPESLIYFICGLDNLSYIDSWKEAEYILTNYHILVIRRSGEDLDLILKRLENYKDNIHVVDMELCDLSSTLIRNSLRNSSKCDDLDEDVYDYIKKGNYMRNK